VGNARLEGVSTAVVDPLHPHYTDLLPFRSSNLYNVQSMVHPAVSLCAMPQDPLIGDLQNYPLLVTVVITKTATDRQSIQSLGLVISEALEFY